MDVNHFCYRLTKKSETFVITTNRSCIRILTNYLSFLKLATVWGFLELYRQLWQYNCALPEWREISWLMKPLGRCLNTMSMRVFFLVYLSISQRRNRKTYSAISSSPVTNYRLWVSEIKGRTDQKREMDFFPANQTILLHMKSTLKGKFNFDFFSWVEMFLMAL